MIHSNDKNEINTRTHTCVVRRMRSWGVCSSCMGLGFSRLQMVKPVAVWKAVGLQQSWAIEDSRNRQATALNFKVKWTRQSGTTWQRKQRKPTIWTMRKICFEVDFSFQSTTRHYANYLVQEMHARPQWTRTHTGTFTSSLRPPPLLEM
jgi:hypothetical protein